MNDIQSWSRQQNQINWQLAVDLANRWRRSLGVREVNYPYPGDPREGLSLNA